MDAIDYAALQPRAYLSFPSGNATNFTNILGSNFNLTTLHFWNYTYYDNGTISNDSSCVLTFPPFTPTQFLFDNGTWINSTSCYQPVLGIHERGGLSIAAGTLFALAVIVTFVCLGKHRKSHVARPEKRFGPWSRTWTWLLMFITCACGAVSGISGVDVDRDYLQDAALIYQNVFFFAMIPFLQATVWESARCWSAVRERIMVEDDPHRFHYTDKRAKAELYVPIIFLIFDFLSFLFTVPRQWGKVSLQRSLEQSAMVAEPAATDGRFKTAGFMAAIAFCLIVQRVYHNHTHYGRHTGEVPYRILLCLPFLGVLVGYLITLSFDFSISILKWDSNPLYMFLLGYLPAIAVIAILCVFGLVEPNADVIVSRHRRIKERSVDIELRQGIQQRKSVGTTLGESSVAMSPAVETDSVDQDPQAPPPSYETALRAESAPASAGIDAAPLRNLSLPATQTTAAERRPSQIIRSMLDV